MMGKMVISRSEAKFQANKKESDNSCWLIFSRLVEREVCSAQGASLALEGRTGIRDLENFDVCRRGQQRHG